VFDANLPLFLNTPSSPARPGKLGNLASISLPRAFLAGPTGAEGIANDLVRDERLRALSRTWNRTDRDGRCQKPARGELTLSPSGCSRWVQRHPQLDSRRGDRLLDAERDSPQLVPPLNFAAGEAVMRC
jgi:hypothetical protein